MATRLELVKKLPTLRNFVSPQQLRVIADNCYGEERQFFIDKMVELANQIETMPQTYEQDGKGDEAVAHLHYFSGGADWYITEKDMEPEQRQAFGLCDIGYGGELGYVCIETLRLNNVELDLHFTPKPLHEIKSTRGE